MSDSDRIVPDRDNTQVVDARIAAQVADLILLLLQLGVVTSVLVVLVRPETAAGTRGLVFLSFLTLPLYGGLLEGYWHGQTVGKRLLGIKVVDSLGEEPSVGTALLRNVPAVVLFSWLTSFVALASMAVTEHRQRVFDTIANTYVVETDRGRPMAHRGNTLGV